MNINLICLFVYPLLLGLTVGQTSITTTSDQIELKASYSDLQQINATCYPKDTCDSKRRDLSPKERTCACDNQCPVYNDCCVDATPKVSPAPSFGKFMQQSSQFVCQEFLNFGYIYVRSECPSYWRGPDSIRLGCEQPNMNRSIEDPLTTMPVTNKVAGTTYRNYFCAICNSENSTSIALWQPLLEFNNLKAYNKTFNNVTAAYIKSHLMFNSTINAWGIYLQGVDTPGMFFYEAKVYPSIPSGLEEKVRECRPGLISSCPANWTDDSVAERCAAFQGAMYLNTVDKVKSYRNAFCALCNGQSVKKLVCVTPKGGKSGLIQRTFSNEAFAVLLDFHDPAGGMVGSKNSTNTCADGQVYDPFHKMCKKLLCGFPWLVVQNNKCVPIGSTKTTVPPAKPVEIEGKSLFPETATRDTSPVQTTISPIVTTTVSDLDETSNESATLHSLIDRDGLTSNSLADEAGGTTMEAVFVMVTEPPPTTTLLPPATVIYDVIEDGNRSDTEVVALTENSTLENFVEYRGINPPYVQDVPQDLDYEKSTESASEDVVTIAYNPAFIDCPKIELNPNQFTLLKNGSINVPAFKMTYDPTDFLIIENTALVCAFFINSTEPSQVSKFSPAMGYVSFIGLGISIVCLVLHLILYIILPDIRNLSTNNLASLSVGLLLAYVCFMVGQASTLPKTACMVFASGTYFFFLSTFMWMSAMSFDVWRTLKLATQELRVTTGRQYKRFVLYSLYAWGLSALCLVAVLIVDNSPSVPFEYRPGFATRTCWFAQRNALLVFFAAPLIAIMTANIALFISSARMILSTTSSTTKNHGCTANSRRNFKLYLRLAVMMGLTWTVGLVAGYLNNEIMWYAFILLNTTQGLFIFISFSCNKKVKKYLGDKMEAITKSHAYRTSSLNSGSGFNTNSTFPSNLSTKTSTSNVSESRMSVNSPPNQKPMFRPSVTSFRQSQDGMETLY